MKREGFTGREALANEIRETRLRIVGWADHGTVEIVRVIHELMDLENFVTTEPKLDDLLTDGINSGAPIEPTPKYWAEKKERLKAASDPKPAPLPHEPCDYATLTCKHCGYDQKRNLYFWQEHCPARSVSPHDNMKQGWSGTGDRSHDRVPKCGSNPPPVASSPPAEKAEALPELSEKVSRPLTAAEKTRGIEIEMSLESRMRQIVHEEIRKARIEMDDFPHIVNSGQWSHRKHLRIVPGKEGE